MIYLLFKENELMREGYTAMRPLCDAYKLPYRGLNQLNKPFLVDGIKYEIKDIRVNKIRGRGANSFNK